MPAALFRLKGGSHTELSVPLSDRFALTGATNLMTPAATGTVDAYMGVTFYPTRSGFLVARNRFAPPFSRVLCAASTLECLSRPATLERFDLHRCERDRMTVKVVGR